MKNFRITFWTHGMTGKEAKADFGCTVHGFANYRQWTEPRESSACTWDMDLEGEVIAGTRDAVMEILPRLGFRPVVCIVLFSTTTGTESFINRLIQVMPGVPLIGGGAAIAEGHIGGELLPRDMEIVLLAVGRGDYELESLNIYDKKDLEVEIRIASPREIELIRILPDGEWQNGASFYRNLQAEFGLERDNFESITFCDKRNRNIHFGIEGELLHAGADLPDDRKLFLRALSEKDAAERVAAFISDEYSLVFACAGIRSLIKTPLYTGKHSLAGFMFGELVMLDDTAAFGNLMLTKLKAKVIR